MRWLLLISLLCTDPQFARADRIKDLVTVKGVRPNQLTGFGIVIGLRGTGDNPRSPVVRRALTQMLKRLGVTVSERDVQARNVAAVIVTAELPAFAKPGSRMDVLVSSMGEAKSLQGGTLIATPLRGADSRTYAVAQGPISLGAFAVEGASGSGQRKNHATVARMPGGATIEREAPSQLSERGVVLLLNQPDFTTATRIADSINRALGQGSAKVRDPGSVLVRATGAFKGRVTQLMAAIEPLHAAPDVGARIVIDERTGTIVIGQHVTLSAAAVAHGGITVTIDEKPVASQPDVLAEGDTVVLPDTQVEVKEADGDLKTIGPAATVADVAAALNALGAKPRDLVPILQALAASGALRAKVELL